MVAHVFSASCALKKFGEIEVVLWDVPQSVLSVLIQNPSGGKEGGSLIALRERLRSCDSISGQTGDGYWNVNLSEIVDNALNSVEVIGVIKPFVVMTN